MERNLRTYLLPRYRPRVRMAPPPGPTAPERDATVPLVWAPPACSAQRMGILAFPLVLGGPWRFHSWIILWSSEYVSGIAGPSHEKAPR